MHRDMKNREHGGALILILITVVLFAALSIAYTQMGDGGSEVMSTGQAKIAASEILDHAKDVERAVNRILIKGTSDNDICFKSDKWPSAFEITQYDHAECTSDNEVFSSTGGGVKWVAPNPDWMDLSSSNVWGQTRWLYTGDAVYVGVGSTEPELAVMLAPLKREVCEAINNSVNLDTDFSINDYPCCGYDASRVFGIGSDRYDNAQTIGDQDARYSNRMTGCGWGDGYHYFWHILIPR